MDLIKATVDPERVEPSALRPPAGRSHLASRSLVDRWTDLIEKELREHGFVVLLRPQRFQQSVNYMLSLLSSRHRQAGTSVCHCRNVLKLAQFENDREIDSAARTSVLFLHELERTWYYWALLKAGHVTSDGTRMIGVAIEGEWKKLCPIFEKMAGNASVLSLYDNQLIRDDEAWVRERSNELYKYMQKNKVKRDVITFIASSDVWNTPLPEPLIWRLMDWGKKSITR